uniref:filamin-A-like isoform X2 n=1 Tax=Callithrix jacchus TaxID=9483 RepID=UPI0023DD1179|nr:filamin-A-like isoform X2 [Callithrix jacchus]
MAAAQSSTSPMSLAPTASTSPMVDIKYQVRRWQPAQGWNYLLVPTLSHIVTIPLTHPSGSPFMVPVHDVTEASKVKCSGPGLSPGMVRANLPQSFQVDTSKADVAPLQVKVQGPKGPRLVEPVDVVDNAHGTQTVNYLPSREGPYSISVLYGDEEVPQSPFKVKVLPSHDGSKVKASGPGLNTTGMPTSLPVEFTIDAKDAGEGLLAVQITKQGLTLSPRWCNQRYHSLKLLDSSNPPASASRVGATIGMCHHNQVIF